MKKLRVHPLLLSGVILWLILLGFASVFDLDISLAIADAHSPFGRFMEIAGEPPAILFTSFNFSLMTAHFIRRADRCRRHLVLGALTFIGCVGTAIFAAVTVADYLVDWGILHGSAPSVIAVIAGICIGAAFLAVTVRMTSERLSRYFDTACRCAYVGIATFVTIWAVKLLWGRVRFRQLDGDLSRFTPWYLPQGVNGYFSFPSGHTANATVIFAVTNYFRFLPEKFRRFDPLLRALLVAWICIAAFSRVRVGAHYLSDVLFGAAITFGIVYFFRNKHD